MIQINKFLSNRCRSYFLCSLRKNYGGVFSLKMGSYKFVMASTPEAVKEVLVRKSVEYAGRPQTYSTVTRTLGRFRNVTGYLESRFYDSRHVGFMLLCKLPFIFWGGKQLKLKRFFNVVLYADTFLELTYFYSVIVVNRLESQLLWSL